jgi:hypothetical protein
MCRYLFLSPLPHEAFENSGNADSRLQENNQ